MLAEYLVVAITPGGECIEVEFFNTGGAKPFARSTHLNNDHGFRELVQDLYKKCSLRSVTQLVIVINKSDLAYRVKHFLASEKSLTVYSPRIYSSPEVDALNVIDFRHREVDFLLSDVQKVSHSRCDLLKELANAKRGLIKDLYLSLDTNDGGSLSPELDLYDEQVALCSIPDLLKWLPCERSCKDQIRINLDKEHPELSVASGLSTKKQRINALEQMIEVADQTLTSMSGLVSTKLLDFLPKHLAVCLALEIGDIYRYQKPNDLVRLAGLLYDDAAREQAHLRSYLLESTFYRVNNDDTFRRTYLAKIQSNLSPKIALRMVSRNLIRVVFKALSTNHYMKGRRGDLWMRKNFIPSQKLL